MVKKLLLKTFFMCILALHYVSYNVAKSYVKHILDQAFISSLLM